MEDNQINDEPVENIDSSLKPQDKGEILEKAMLELIHQFFIIAEEEERFILKKLRKQKRGLQFGFDMSFECTVKGKENVRCHIECKNKRDDIVLKDIADKIISTEAFCSDIDHWILISPHSGPSNELDILLSSWREKREYPFEIQMWCPETGVQEFFGLSPAIFDLFYKTKDNETHPSQWSEEKRLKVIEKWDEKLRPPIRLPTEWEEYLRAPFRLCMKGEESNELKTLCMQYVPMRCMDERENIIGQSLEKYVFEWLEDIKTPVMVLLGDFGDGKTAFTYILSCRLAEEFIKDPSTGWIPVRFALRDYHSAGSSQEFLRRRLEEFGADIASWNKLKEQYNLLVVLDGFDEMTKKLDSTTITKNINDLIECCNEFQDLKILITSRKHFFEKQRDKKRLLQRLPSNRVCSLAPIDRRINIDYLEKFAGSIDAKEKLNRIRKMHDPIGLASKPLFHQMIKETLPSLPEDNLDEIILYETYIKASLNRKIENLDDYGSELLPDEIHSNLLGIFELIALKLQESKESYISLAEFSSADGINFAEHLWHVSGSDVVISVPEKNDETVVEDATARVGVRSLLTRVKTADDTCKWPVDFCHRSMREYFVARGISNSLRNDIGRAKELLSNLQLNNEILYFAAEIMRKDNSENYVNNLLSLIRTTKGANENEFLGGNAVTLLFRLKGELLGDDWSKLNLDYADLSGADLSHKNFSATSLCYANLDNVNFEGADFRDSDLTGVRLEETSTVLAVNVHPLGNRIIAAYGDNTIREWNIAQTWQRESRIIGKNTKGTIDWLGVCESSDLCAMTDTEIIFYDLDDQRTLLQRSRFRMKPEYRQVVPKKDFLLLLSEEEHHTNKLLLVNLQQRNIVASTELKNITLCENLDLQTFVFSEGKSFLRIKRLEDAHLETVLTLQAHDMTCLRVYCCKEGSQYLLACGQRNGEVLVWLLDLFKNEWKEKLLLKNRAHDGIVSALAFLDISRIISGGMDRKISILRFGPDSAGLQGIQEQILHLTINCKGLKIEGLKGNREREMLKKLILKA